MVELVRKYNFTDVKSVKERRSLLGCVFDWFEVRVHELPDVEELAKYGYVAQLDKGCATHSHYFENDDFSVSWDIKSSYIEKGWTHLRVKNHKFYSILGYNSIVDYVKILCKSLFTSEQIIIVRVDFAFDMSIKSDLFRHIRAKFRTHNLENVEKYTHFIGKVGNYQYINYSAGGRGGRFFYRLYNKTVENQDYQTGQPKKQYIADWHKQLFNDDMIYRFEIEYKPLNTLLSEFVYNNFRDFALKYFEDENIKIFSGENYVSTNEFTKKDAANLMRLINKFVGNKVQNCGLHTFLETTLIVCEAIINS